MPESPLVGGWRLVAMESHFSDGRVTRPLGDELDGYLIYSAEGWVSAMVLQANRQFLKTGYGPLRSLTAEERESVLSTANTVYQATYTISGDMVTHNIKASVHPNGVGRDEVRAFKIAGNRLILTTPPRNTPSGSMTIEIVWERVESTDA